MEIVRTLKNPAKNYLCSTDLVLSSLLVLAFVAFAH